MMKVLRRIARPAGWLLLTSGAVMVSVSAFYLYAYSRSGSDADRFNVEAASPTEYLEHIGLDVPKPDRGDGPETMKGATGVERNEGSKEAMASVARETVSTVRLPAASERLGRTMDEPTLGAPNKASAIQIGVIESGDTDVETGTRSELTTESGGSVEIPSEAMLAALASVYPGGSMNPRYWADPQWAGNMPFGGPTIPEGFVPVAATDLTTSIGDGEPALRLRIPAIELDASVSELEILDLGDSRAWSTPDKVVGHIPTTANPGEAANGWYFGHLEAFLSDEGDIFRRLPEIADMIDNDPVDVFIETSDAEYIYRVTGTKQLHRDHLRITETKDAQITLVTCWPFKVYDHRVVVNAVLIAVKQFDEA